MDWKNGMSWQEFKLWYGLQGETEEEVRREYYEFLTEIADFRKRSIGSPTEGLFLLLPIPIVLVIYALYVCFVR